MQTTNMLEIFTEMKTHQKNTPENITETNTQGKK